MTTVAIVYHSGYGHTAVLADKVAQGVRDAGQTAVLLNIESAAQDFGPLIEEATKADAIIFGAPTYMGDVSGVFKVFADATAGVSSRAAGRTSWPRASPTRTASPATRATPWRA
jgi:NAD(P)H dehydrogenase (quinone)